MMALVIFNDGSKVMLKPEQALAVWEILIGEREPENDKQESFCCRVKRIYLNRHTAPESYLRKFPQGQDIEQGSYAQVLGKRI